MFTIKKFTADNITPHMLLEFHHYQVIDRKYVNVNNEWREAQACELREWDTEKRIWITKYLQQQIERGGAVMGAFTDNVLVGFCSIDGYLYGEREKYSNLAMLFVDDEWKRKGIGKALFREACDCAVKNGADKLFISAIPSIETVAFYFSMGCIDAKEIIAEYMDTENDRCLEYLLK